MDRHTPGGRPAGVCDERRVRMARQRPLTDNMRHALDLLKRDDVLDAMRVQGHPYGIWRVRNLDRRDIAFIESYTIDALVKRNLVEIVQWYNFQIAELV